MKITYNLFFSLLMVFIISSCDIITDPIPDGLNPTDTTVTEEDESKRRILLEDYTGHYCGNCPGAALLARQLHDIYKEQLIIMGVHAGFFADLHGSKYTTDFRTEASEEYDLHFGVSAKGNPNGLINRAKIINSSNPITLPADWSTAIEQIKNDLAKVKITFTKTQNGDKFDVKADVTILEELSGTYNLVFCLTEDSIIAYQKNYAADAGGDPNYPTPEASDYVHRHVLRDNLNGTWGTELFNGTAAVNEVYTVNVNNYAPDADWDLDQLHLIAFVFDNSSSSPTQFEVLQSKEVKLKE